MDINPAQQDKKMGLGAEKQPAPSASSALPKPISPIDPPEIKTMKKDIEGLGGKFAPSKKGGVPLNLPVSEPTQKPSYIPPKPAGPSVPPVPPTPRPGMPSYELKKEIEKEVGKREDLKLREAMKEKPAGPSFAPKTPPTPPTMPAPSRLAPPSLDELLAKEGRGRKATFPLEPSAPKPKRNILKPILIGLAIIFVLTLIAGGFFYWWNYMRVEPPKTHFACQDSQCILVEGEGIDECQTNDECAVSEEPVEPISLISVTDTEVIEIETGEEDSILNKINEFAAGETEKGVLKRILVKITSEDEKKFASLTEFVSAIGLKISSEASTYLDLDYTAFVYFPANANGELERCQDANIFDPKCYGPRLGLVMGLENKEGIADSLKEWETTMFNDLKPMILAAVLTEGPIEFKDSSEPNYQGADFIRYINLPVSSISIDYGVINNFLVIGTSRASFRKALDAIKP